MFEMSKKDKGGSWMEWAYSLRVERMLDKPVVAVRVCVGLFFF